MTRSIGSGGTGGVYTGRGGRLAAALGPSGRPPYNPPMAEDSLVDTIRKALEGRPEPIAAAYLFGSAARGTDGPGSDVDVAVLFREDPPPTLEGLGLDIEADLERRLRRTVQLCVLNRAPVDLVHRVLRDGRLVLESDRSRRIAFEVDARNRFFDLEPYLQRYRRASVA